MEDIGIFMQNGMMNNPGRGANGSSLYGTTTCALEKRLADILRRATPPPVDYYARLLASLNIILEYEDERIRPKDAAGFAGGILYLSPAIPTIIMPDLHARMDFFLSTMLTVLSEGYTVFELLASKRLQVVCLGDAFHAEGRRMQRWKLSLAEFQSGFKKHKHMDEEMRESMGVMEMVMEVKRAFPGHFHFLKGNHENISNEKGGGNYPFRKYALEGAMVVDYVTRFYGGEFLKLFYLFEKNLPLLAVGANFLITHAEPRRFYDRRSVINYRTNADVVYGLTWTDNDEAEAGSVRAMIEHYLPREVWDEARHFGGHRPVAGASQTRANGAYIQIHNPQKFQVTLVGSYQPIDKNACMLEIKNKIPSLFPQKDANAPKRK